VSDIAIFAPTIGKPEFSLTSKAPFWVALLVASRADHLQARNEQIAGLLLAGCSLRLSVFRFSHHRFVGYEAADSQLMPDVPVKLNGAAA
jgi:hypothetical protein